MLLVSTEPIPAGGEIRVDYEGGGSKYWLSGQAPPLSLTLTLSLILTLTQAPTQAPTQALTLTLTLTLTRRRLLWRTAQCGLQVPRWLRGLLP